MSRFKVWWCKTFHRYAGHWWGWTPTGSHFYCCLCNRELFTDVTADKPDDQPAVAPNLDGAIVKMDGKIYRLDRDVTPDNSGAAT